MDINELKRTQVWKDMVEGRVYDAPDARLVNELNRVKGMIKEYNEIDPLDAEMLDVKIRGLLGGCGRNVKVLQPFRCDYGCNISVGDDFFANFNFTVLDEALVKIGNNVFVGPNVSIYTACHPTDADERRDGREWAEGVTIGDDCWICGSVTIVPGVTIGNGVTIGAGSVVTRDIPDNCVAAGNPARVIKKLK